MANFKTTVTDYGAQVLTSLLAQDKSLTLVRAAAGSGRLDGTWHSSLNNLLERLEIECQLQEVSFIVGSPSVTQVAVQLTNRNLNMAAPVRELGVWARDGEGEEFLFAYSWLDGEDSDNILPPTGLEDGAPDTIHLHDICIAVANGGQGDITIEIGAGSFVTFGAMESYAAPKQHFHNANAVTETTGETVEAAQRRQDYAIAALQEQLNTGFTGTTAVLDFSPAQLGQWKGFDGTGMPEGVWSAADNTLRI